MARSTKSEFIPLEPEEFAGTKQISPRDRMCLTYFVVFGVTGPEAFRVFNPGVVNPGGDLTDVGKTMCSQFFSYQPHKDYIRAYKATLLKRIGTMKRPKYAGDNDNDTEEEVREKSDNKTRVVGHFTRNVISAVENSSTLDVSELKDQADLLKKINYLKEEEIVIEPPRRYLPQSCENQCRYRLFCEQSIENGDVIDECEYCRARKYAEERGFHYDAKTNLDIPRDVLDKINNTEEDDEDKKDEE